MAFRKKCIRRGHKFKSPVIGSAVPYVFCSRKKCDAITVAEWCPAMFTKLLHNSLPESKRVPRGQM